MRVVQLIDSLEPGGAERMAVNIANALVTEVEFSGLVTTRYEGTLKHNLDSGIGFEFLNKKSRLDIRSLFKLIHYLKRNKITHIHAHSSSWFYGVLSVLLVSNVKLIWHDHYGNSEFLEKRSTLLLSFASYFFSGIISVNAKLQDWANVHLKCTNVIGIPNFYFPSEITHSKTTLEGASGRRIICLANLRPQKDHFFLLEVAKEVVIKNKEWSFHLIGKDFDDDYSMLLKQKIKENNLEFKVFLYGSKEDVLSILSKSDIGILTSISEGLPVSLLEYGFQKLPVVVTAVGEIPKLITNGKNGYLINHGDKINFIEKLTQLIESSNLREELGNNLKKTVDLNFSKNNFLKEYFQFINNI